MPVEDRLKGIERHLRELDRRTAKLLDLIQALTQIMIDGYSEDLSAVPALDAITSQLDELNPSKDLWFG